MIALKLRNKKKVDDAWWGVLGFVATAHLHFAMKASKHPNFSGKTTQALMPIQLQLSTGNMRSHPFLIKQNDVIWVESPLVLK